jgi:hypothetical protein
MNPVQPIQNAKDTLLNQRPGTVPDVRGGILDYFRPLILTRVTKTVVNLVLVEDEEQIETSGMIQPAKQRLTMKPEGQRKWNLKTLYTLPVVVLNPDEIVTIVDLVAGNTSYRVMGKRDWSESGYVEYDLEQDYS